jgi:hypothetical protein
MQILLLWNYTDKKYIELRYNTGFYKVYKNSAGNFRTIYRG